MRWIRRTTFLAGALFAAISLAREGGVQDARGAEPQDSFAIVVRVERDGIALECERGCAWKELSAVFPGTEYRISDRGVRPARPRPGAAASFQSDAFAIVMDPRKPAVTAECVTGCVWKTVSASHPLGVYRMTESGIVAEG